MAMTPIERADKLMGDWFGKRWAEDSHLVNVWVAIQTAIADAVAAEKERCARVADAAEHRNWHGDGTEDTSPEAIAAAIRSGKEPKLS